MGKFLKFLKEIENGKEIQTILPSATLYDMQHFFTNKNRFGLRIFEECLGFLSDMRWHNSEEYKEENPTNAVLLHAEMYKSLLDLYKKYLNTDLDDPFLITKQVPSVQPITLSWAEYNKIPARFRGIWKQTDDGYILNITNNPMVIAVVKNQKEKLKTLLKRADILLPVIYKETTPNIDFGGKLQLFESPSKTLFVSNSISANRVSDEQLKTIKELKNIFVEISKITFPVRTKISVTETSGALDIFNEYHDELTRKNIFVKTNNESKAVQAQKQIELRDAKRKYKKDEKNINSKYTHLHNEMIALLKLQTNMNIK